MNHDDHRSGDDVHEDDDRWLGEEGTNGQPRTNGLPNASCPNRRVHDDFPPANTRRHRERAERTHREAPAMRARARTRRDEDEGTGERNGNVVERGDQTPDPAPPKGTRATPEKGANTGTTEPRGGERGGTRGEGTATRPQAGIPTRARSENPEEAPGAGLGVAGGDAVGHGQDVPVVIAGAEIRGESTPSGRAPNHALPGSAPVRTARNRAPRSGRKDRTAPGRPKRWVSRYTSSARFRTAVARACPGLGDDGAYWRMMELLLFGSSRSRSRPVLLPHPVIADVCGVDPHDGGFRSGEFLEAFQRDVLPGFTWEDYDHAGGLVREVVTDGVPPSILAALALEMAVHPRSMPDRVYFASGFSYDARRDPKALREADLRHATMLKLPETEDQRFIQGYLHGLDVRRFSFLDGTFDGAYATALGIENEAARTQAMRLLHRIYVQPVPFYSPVANSLRLFSIVGGLQQVHRRVREALMRGCWDLDGDAVHLAIVARVWGIPELHAFLGTSGAAAIWRSLTAHVARVCHGRDPEAEPLSEGEHGAYKAALKHGVYALTYGGGAGAIADQIGEHDGDGLFDDYDAVVDALKGHELLGRVFEAKNRMLERIKRDKGMAGAYGFVRLKRGRKPLSVLAMVSSSYELSLMRSVFEVAAEHPDLCAILLYQFDGVTVRFRGEDRAGWIVRKMQAAFDAKARALGIPTQLSSERL